MRYCLVAVLITAIVFGIHSVWRRGYHWYCLPVILAAGLFGGLLAGLREVRVGQFVYRVPDSIAVLLRQTLGFLLAAFVSVVFCVLIVALLRPRVNQTPGSPSEGSCCSHCGYNLHGLREPRCPECGTLFDPSFLSAMSQRMSERGRR